MWFVALVVWAGFLSFVWLLLRTLERVCQRCPLTHPRRGTRCLGTAIEGSSDVTRKRGLAVAAHLILGHVLNWTSHNLDLGKAVDSTKPTVKYLAI